MQAPPAPRGKLHDRAIARRVPLALPAGEVEHECEGREGLSDRFARELVVSELRHELGDLGRLNRVDGAVAEHWEDPAEVHVIRPRSARSNAASRLPPALSEISKATTSGVPSRPRSS